MNRRHVIVALLSSLLLLLAACGDGGTSVPVAPAGSGAPEVAGGGIGGTGKGGTASVGGTGKGTISGYDGIVINDDRHFTLGPDSTIRLDGVPIEPAELEARGTGFVARLLLGDDVDPAVTSGTALDVSVDHYLAGPVTADAPELHVLGQPVVVDPDTQLVSLVQSTWGAGWELWQLKDLKSFEPGRIARVSGYPGPDNRVLATRLELLPDELSVWRLTGPVSDLVPGSSFRIRTQVVHTAGITLTGCEDGLQNGDIVLVEAAADPGFAPGDPLETVIRITCLLPGLEIPAGSGASLAAVVEGLVGSAAMPVFTVDGQQVLTTPDTIFRLGGPQDVAVGTKVEAQGTLDTETGILTATQIRFRDLDVHIRGPLYPEDVKPGEHLEILGIRIYGTPDTKDTKGVLAGALTQPDQIDLVGYLDVDGKVYAKRITRSGTFDPANVDLRGPVDKIEGGSLFSILDVLVDATKTRRFADGEGNSLTQEQFFSALRIDDSVGVGGATYDQAGVLSSPAEVQLLSLTGSGSTGGGDQGGNEQ